MAKNARTRIREEFIRLAKQAEVTPEGRKKSPVAFARAIFDKYPQLSEWDTKSGIKYRHLSNALRSVLGVPKPGVIPGGTPPNPAKRKAKSAAYFAKKYIRDVPAPSSDRAAFYLSQEWRELRYRVLKAYGARCQCCGATPADGVKMHVDHIKPRYYYPELSLVESNLQVLCEPCNLGKRHLDTTDWRDKA